MRDINVPVRLVVSTSESVSDALELPTTEQCQHWAQSACVDERELEASLQIVSKPEMQELNRDYRGKDKPTNVLSFPMQLPEEVGLAFIGDLAVCADVVAEEAAEQGKAAEAHWAHMVIHGMLHLQGYDHIEDDEAEAMEILEIRILDQLGYANPYLNNH